MQDRLMNEKVRKPLVVMVAAFVLVLGACSDDSGDDEGGGASTTSTPTESTDPTGGTGDDAGDARVIVFNGQGNNLDAYDGEPPFTSQRLITAAADDPEAGLDINAQICLWEDDGTTYFISGEDTGQPDPPAGWGIFELEGQAVGDLSATQVGKLTPTYQPGADRRTTGAGCCPTGAW
jgi:hypothetical protein